MSVNRYMLYLGNDGILNPQNNGDYVKYKNYDKLYKLAATLKAATESAQIACRIREGLTNCTECDIYQNCILIQALKQWKEFS